MEMATVNKLTLATLALLLGTTVNAHSMLESTSPEDGAILGKSPTEIELSFSDNLRLTKVQANHSGGGTQPISLDSYSTFTNAYTLLIEPMGAGLYEVEWRGLGVDGHAMHGTFSFEVE